MLHSQQPEEGAEYRVDRPREQACRTAPSSQAVRVARALRHGIEWNHQRAYSGGARDCPAPGHERRGSSSLARVPAAPRPASVRSRRGSTGCGLDAPSDLLLRDNLVPRGSREGPLGDVGGAGRAIYRHGAGHRGRVQRQRGSRAHPQRGPRDSATRRPAARTGSMTMRPVCGSTGMLPKPT
jgi:hypothetical protein